MSLKLTPGEQARYCSQHPSAFEAPETKQGAQGWTYCELDELTTEAFEGAVRSAWEAAAGAGAP